MVFRTHWPRSLEKEPKGYRRQIFIRLKKGWENDDHQWEQRDRSEKTYAYIRADGVHFNIRPEDERSCILVVIGADEAGNKESIALSDGYRESSLSWKEMLIRLRDEQGLKDAPKLAIGDGALGFWKALDEVYPGTKHQRCRVPKTTNILDKMPRSIQGKAKSMIHEMSMAESEENSLKAYNHFVSVYGDQYPKAIGCLRKDKTDLFSIL